MAQTYRVKIVNEHEWNEIVKSENRYEHVDDTNLGFSDPLNKRSYVREEVIKSWPGVKTYLLQHEFDHLISDDKLHEDEHGVRHKKFFKQALLPAIGIGAGGLLGGPVGATIGGGLGYAAGGGLKKAKQASQTPQIPNLSQLPSVQRFGQQSQAFYSPLIDRFRNLSNTPLPESLASPISRNIRRQRDIDLGGLLYEQSGAGPGQSAYDRLQQEYAQREAESLANAQLGFQGNERQNILGEFGVGTTQLQSLASLAGLDVDQIMAQTGLDAQRASQFREMFGNILGGAGKIGTAAALSKFGIP